MRALVVCAVCIAVALAGEPFAIDLGSQFIKVAAPKNNATIDVLLNEQSRRKSDNFVGFRKGSKFVADEAKSLAGRFPHLMVPMVHQFAGLPYRNATALLSQLGYTNSPQENDRGVASFTFDTDVTYSADELLAMVLDYVAEFATSDLGLNATDVVFAVPYHYTPRQREAIRAVAKLSGLKVLRFVNSLTAAALQYGVTRRGDSTETTDIVIVDVGSSKTEIGAFRFTPPPEGRVKLAEALGTLQLLHVESLSTTGGRSIDQCLAKMIDAAHVKAGHKSLFGDDVDATVKYALMRAAATLKEVLSANNVGAATVEGAGDGEFMTTIRRADFEDSCGGEADKIGAAVQRAIVAAGITNAVDLKAVELIGAASRVPMIGAKLTDSLGRAVDRTLNSDETVALGAAVLATRASPFIRIKGYAIVEPSPYAMGMQVKASAPAAGTSDKPPQPRRLFETCTALPCTASMSVHKRQDDFDVSVTHVDGDGVGKSVVAVQGVKAALDKEMNGTVCIGEVEHAVRLEFVMDESGIITPPRNASVRRIAQGCEPNDKKKRWFATVMPTRTFGGKARPLAGTSFAAAKQVLTNLRQAELAARAMALAKNDLETEVSVLKDRIADLPAAEQASDMVSALSATLRTLGDWLEVGGDGDAVTADACTTRLGELRELAAKTFATETIDESEKKEDL